MCNLYYYDVHVQLAKKEKEIANCGNFVTAAILDILEMWSKEFSEGEIINLNVVMKSCSDEKDEDVPEYSQNSHVKGAFAIISQYEREKMKCLKLIQT